MYNATVYTYDAGTGSYVGKFLALAEERNGRLQMLRSNFRQCTGFEGKSVIKDDYEMGWARGDAAFDAYIRAAQANDVFEIVLDGGAGYLK